MCDRKLTPSDFTSKYGCNDGDEAELVDRQFELIDKVCERINKLGLPLKAGWHEIQTSHNSRRIRWLDGSEVEGCGLSFEEAPYALIDAANEEIQKVLDEVECRTYYNRRMTMKINPQWQDAMTGLINEPLNADARELLAGFMVALDELERADTKLNILASQSRTFLKAVASFRARRAEKHASQEAEIEKEESQHD
jgi:hypothetical protein